MKTGGHVTMRSFYRDISKGPIEPPSQGALHALLAQGKHKEKEY